MTRDAVRAIAAAACLFAAWPAAAQPGGEPPLVAVAGGVGLAVPFHGDYGFRAVAWDADVRIRLSHRVLLEAGVGDWRHVERTVATGVPDLGRVTYATSHTRRSWQVNALATVPLVRARLAAGGGVGLVHHRRVTDVTADGCAGGLVCSLQESRSSRASASVQALAGIDVGVVGPLAVGSTLRLIVPLRGPEDADVRLIVAARLGFG